MHTIASSRPRARVQLQRTLLLIVVVGILLIGALDTAMAKKNKKAKQHEKATTIKKAGRGDKCKGEGCDNCGDACECAVFGYNCLQWTHPCGSSSKSYANCAYGLSCRKLVAYDDDGSECTSCCKDGCPDRIVGRDKAAYIRMKAEGKTDIDTGKFCLTQGSGRD